MKLLKKLYHIDSSSRKEENMIAFVESWLQENNLSYTKDESGNILITKGESETYPCVVAHMDEVQDPRPEDYSVKRDHGVLYAFSPSQRGQCGLGADDKNGMWVAMQLLKKLPALKVAFFVGEEIGCVGSSKVDMSFFDNVRFVVQCDRRNGGDFIHRASGVKLCEPSFMKAVHMEQFGYKPCTGMLTDVLTLRERGLAVSACNLSCGYYFPHTEKEVTVWPELERCLRFVEYICTHITDVQKATVVEPYTPYNYGYHGGYTLSFFNQDDYEGNWWEEDYKGGNSGWINLGGSQGSGFDSGSVRSTKRTW